MHHQPLYYPFLVIILLTSFLPAVEKRQESRTWTDRTGRELDATFLGASDGMIEIKRSSDGQVFKLPLKNFSDLDQDYVRSQMKIPGERPATGANRSFQVGDPNPQFDESKFDPNYPQMQVWRLAGVSTGIPILQDQLNEVTRKFEAGATEEEIGAYFFIDGQRNLITGCRVTRIRHISMQNPSCKENVFYGNDIQQEFSFHSNDGGDNLIENNRITIPKGLTNYNAIMGPWSFQHQVGGLNFIYNNQCKEEHSRKTPWSDSKLYTGPHFISNQQGKERYENFKPAKTPPPIGGTLYPLITDS